MYYSNRNGGYILLLCYNQLMGDERIGSRMFLSLILFSSLASLSFEIALMRVFSVSLWYHFAFMVISIAMLGIAGGGTALSVFPGLKKAGNIPLYCLLLAAGIPASYLVANAIPFDPARLSWDRAQLFFTALYYLVLSFPFFFFGLVVSTAYATAASEANAVYTADLTGAGLGALAMVWLLSLGGPEQGVFIISLLLATGILSFAKRKMRIATIILLVLDMTVLTFQPGVIQPRISQYKPLELALKFPGSRHIGTAYNPSARLDLFTGPAARFAPGLSFRYLEHLPEQTGLALDAAELHAVTDEKDAVRLRFLRYLPSSLVYRFGAREDVLLIDPRGGLAELTAREFGAKAITSVESSPLVRDVVREYGKKLSSSVYQANSFTGLGRTWLAATGRRFDAIELSLMGSLPSASFGFAEDYRFTKEAIREYLLSLNDEGAVSFTLYIIPPPRTELRLLATIIEAAEELGIRDVSRHLAAVRSWDTLTIIMKRSPLTNGEIAAIRRFSRELRFDLVHLPGLRPEESNLHIRMQGSEYYEAFRKLIDPGTSGRFLREYLFDVRPVTDERPFFHYYLKFGNIRETYRVMGEKWQYFFEEGYLLPLLLIQAMVVGAILLLLPLIKSRKSGSRRDAEAAEKGRGDTLLSLAYFALLGLAFLFVEIAFIQKMVLALEHPAYAASTVIAATLISSGIGSLISQRFGALRHSRSLLVLSGLVLAMSAFLPVVIAAIGHYPMPARVALAALAVLPAGLFMGIPFPLGMSSLGRNAPDLIPWAWAVNGCFSVLSPILAIMLALVTGFRTVLIAGAGMYLLAYWVMGRRWAR